MLPPYLLRPQAPCTFPPAAAGTADTWACPDPNVTGTLVRQALRDFQSGDAYGAKAVIQPSGRELLALLDTDQLDPRFANERLNWKLNALVSANQRYCATKLVGSNAYNRLRDLPRSQSLIVLYEKLGMTPLAILDGTEISARRTGAYASVVVDTLLATRKPFSVVLFGAGPIADCFIDDLHAHHGERIERVTVVTRTPATAQRFAATASTRTGLPISAAQGKQAAGNADLIITATNTRAPVLARQDVNERSVLLHLGGDELAPDLVAWMLEEGRVVCDDVDTVSHRNSQSLALFFSRTGRTLHDAARDHRIANLPNLLAHPAKETRSGPALVTCVGLPVLDLYLAQWVYEQQRAGG